MYNYGLTRKFNKMKKEIYIVTISSANYCGAEDHCAVWACSEEDAMELAQEYAEEYYYEQDSDQYMEENDGEEADGGYGNVNCAVALKGSSFEEFYADEAQRNAYYPLIN